MGGSEIAISGSEPRQVRVHPTTHRPAKARTELGDRRLADVVLTVHAQVGSRSVPAVDVYQAAVRTCAVDDFDLDDPATSALDLALLVDLVITRLRTTTSRQRRSVRPSLMQRYEQRGLV